MKNHQQNMDKANQKQTNRRQSKRGAPDSGSDVSETETENVFDSTSFIRWFIIEGTDGNSPIDKLSPFVIGKALNCSIGTLKTVKRLQRGAILVEADTKSQSDQLTRLSLLADTPVRCSPHRTLNICKGVVRSKELTYCTKEEILEELKSQGVTDSVNITVKADNGRRPTNTFILSFRLSQPPKFIKVSYLRIPVAVFIPNPLRCFKCQKYGHGKSTCRGSLICARCGVADHADEGCTSSARCANCGGDHTAFDKDCPVWKREKQVQQIKADKGCSFIEARRLVTAPHQTRTMAAVVASHSFTKPATPAATTSSPKKAHKAVQTDFTWPLDSPSPIFTANAESQTTGPVPPHVDRAGVAGSSSNSKSPTHKHTAKVHPRGGLPATKNIQKKPRINRPPRHSHDPVAMYNRYGVLDDHHDPVHDRDRERMESDDYHSEPGIS